MFWSHRKRAGGRSFRNVYGQSKIMELTEYGVEVSFEVDQVEIYLGGPMSALDVQALETNFNTWRKERVPHLSISDAFERYAVEQVLKDADLSDDEIDSGLFGGADDGGVDGMYLF